MADQPFVSWPFLATGGSQTRTMPDRLHDTINVLDYGADPTGASDSTTAIQNAINAATNSGVAGSSGGTVFFPPGTYKVNGTLSPYSGTANTRISLIGSGKSATTISGTNNSSYLFLSGDGGRFEEVALIANITWNNLSNTAGTGAVSLANLICSKVDNCEFSGYIGLSVASSTFSSLISNCNFIGRGVAGSIGIRAGQNSVIGCQFTDWGTGLTGCNGGEFIGNCYFETCGTAIKLGAGIAGDPFAQNTLTAFSICGCAIHNCDTGINCDSQVTCGYVGGVFIDGNTGAFLATPQYGIYINDGSVIAFEGCSITAKCSSYGIYCNNYGVSFTNCSSALAAGAGGTNWRMPTSNPFGWNFVNCNNPTNVGVFTDLPGSPIDGMIFDISNASITGGSSVWGGVVTGGGTVHARVRYNGTNWTAVGK